MVQVKYKGLNALFVGGYKIVAGLNEIEDDDFYKMMGMKTFRFRIEQKILEVPNGFPLEKPPGYRGSNTITVSPEKKSDGVESKAQWEKLSVRGKLILISGCVDLEFLQSLIDYDSSVRVVAGAKKRIEFLSM